MRFKVGKNPKRSMCKLVQLVFTNELLMKSSVTGKASNARKGKEIKPALDEIKLNAVFGKFSV